MAGLSSPGIGSNLDVNGIVSKLMSVEQRPLQQLAKKEAVFQSQLSAFGSIKGAVSTFQGALAGLSDASKFTALSATSSDNGILTTSASSTAVAGTYSLDITSLAQSQKLVAAGTSSTTASIGTGVATTLTFDFGTIDIAGPPAGSFNSTTGKYTGATFTASGAGTKTVTIDATNNSLLGIRDAINNAKIGVTATIINDGGTSPYRLSLTSSNIGKTNSMRISVAGEAALGTLLAHDPANDAGQNLAETATAQNSEFKVDGVAISKPSTSISDVIQGVTLNLLKSPSTTPVSVVVSRNNTAVTSSVSAFVKAYNDLNGTLKNLTSYNAETKEGAILQGNVTVLTLQSQIRAVLNSPITNSSGALNTLSQAGLSFQKDGTLALDTGKLSSALNNNPDDVAALFAAVGKASDSLVNYTSATSATKPGKYEVNISTLPTQGSATGNADLTLAPNTIAAGTSISVTLDGTSAVVPLAAGTYTATQLAALIQSAINGTTAFSSLSSSVAATINGGFLNVTSTRYGSASNISMSDGAGTPVSNFMGVAPPAPVAGVDVAGAIGGQIATGSGQSLTSGAGDSTGLAIKIIGGLTGARGTVNYSHGYAYNLNTLATSLLATNGLLDGKTTGINSSIKEIANQRAEVNKRLAMLEARYRKEFTRLDMTIGSMTATSNYLAQQLANLPKPY